jgi:hypothetical protein
METLFMYRLKILDVAEFEQDAGGSFRQRKCAPTPRIMRKHYFR